MVARLKIALGWRAKSSNKLNKKLVMNLLLGCGFLNPKPMIANIFGPMVLKMPKLFLKQLVMLGLILFILLVR